MALAVTTDTVLRLPLDTLLELDLSPLLDGPDDRISGFYFSDTSFMDGLNLDGLRMSFDAESGRLLLAPTLDWAGLADDPAFPGTPVGFLIVQFEIAERMAIPVLATEDPRVTAQPPIGTAGRDVLSVDLADAGLLLPAQIVDTRGGSDRVAITNGSAVVLGRAGDDTLTGWDGNDALYGGGGDDSLTGGAGADNLVGLNGEDRLFGGEGHDLLDGGNGNDLLTGGAGDDTLRAGEGTNVLRGEAGDDLLQIAALVRMDSLTGTSSTQTVFGGEGDDLFEIAYPQDVGVIDRASRDGPDVDYTVALISLHGGAGDDTFYMAGVEGGEITGGTGNDTIYGGQRGDSGNVLIIEGNDGDDMLYGGGVSYLYGGNGDDVLSSANGIWGGNGDDTIYASTNELNVSGVVYGGAGLDEIYGTHVDDTLHGGDDADNVIGGDGADRLFGGGGDDALNGQHGADTLSGGDGDDTILLGDNNSLLGYDETMGMAALSDIGYGGAGNDTITLDRAGHQAFGGAGDDTITVGDWAFSGMGSMLYGGTGNDTITAQGHSTVTTGEGADLVVLDLYARANGRGVSMTITDFVRGEDKLDIAWEGGNARQLTFLLEPVPPGSMGYGLSGFAWQDGFLLGFQRYEGDDTVTEATLFLQGVDQFDISDIHFVETLPT